jgi:hypothetical protein
MRRSSARYNYLFTDSELQRSLDATILELRSAVDAVPTERFLNTAHEDLVAHLVEKYGVEQVVMQRELMFVDGAEAQIDVSYDHSRWIDDRSRPLYRPGQKIVVHIPFTGEAPLLKARPSTYTTTAPIAEVVGNELILTYQVPDDVCRDIKPELDATIAQIEQYLQWQQPQIFAHNSNLPGVADTAINERRRRLLSNSQRLASLGIPVRTRAEAPSTYTIPTIRKKASPGLPPASSAPFQPEPTWAMDQYEHALNVIQQMTLVMERSPSAFSTMDEEALRQHFLVQLNGQFEGRATGETFNLNGKTDILLREGSRNAFIAECKFWKGPKKFREAIDQLLGYTAWRDSKTAILVFNRGTSTSTVLEGVKEMCQTHPNLKRVVDWPHASGYRYIFHQNGDQNREFLMTVLVFDVPTEEN